MALFNLGHLRPVLGRGCFVAPGAIVGGKVSLGANSSIWFNAVVRGDVNEIIVGENTNVQDLCMLHVTEENRLVLGKNVSLGHSVVLHGCNIGDSCLIGMGAIILDGAVIGENSVVAAGTLISPGKVFPPGSMIMGRPGKVIRDLSEEEKERYGNHYKSYLGYKDQYLNDKAFQDSLLNW